MAEKKNNKTQQPGKTVLFTAMRCAAAFVLCLALLFGMLCLTSCIPASAIRENIHRSAVYMVENEGDFYMRRAGDMRTMIHDYADAVYLNMLYSIDGPDRVLDCIAAPLYGGVEGVHTSQTENLLARMEGDLPPTAVYDRYWHGMLIFLRPLLVFTDITGARNCITAVLFALLGILCVLLWRRNQRDLAVILLIGAAAIRFSMLGQCIEYAPAWLVGLSFGIGAVFMENASEEKLCIFFVLAGTCCAFYDFLTTETVTVVLPLTVVLCGQYSSGKRKTFREGLRLCILAGAVWGIAYGAAFVSKWILAELTLGGGRIATALGQASYRQGAQAAGKTFSASQSIVALGTNLWILLLAGTRFSAVGTVVVFCVFLAVLSCIVYLFRRKWEDCALPVLLYLLALVPVLRMLVLNNHSLQHAFFTYRALFSTLVCLLLATVRILDYDLICGKNRKKGKKK